MVGIKRWLQGGVSGGSFVEGEKWSGQKMDTSRLKKWWNIACVSQVNFFLFKVKCSVPPSFATHERSNWPEIDPKTVSPLTVLRANAPTDHVVSIPWCHHLCYGGRRCDVMWCRLRNTFFMTNLWRFVFFIVANKCLLFTSSQKLGRDSSNPGRDHGGEYVSRTLPR